MNIFQPSHLKSALIAFAIRATNDWHRNFNATAADSIEAIRVRALVSESLVGLGTVVVVLLALFCGSIQANRDEWKKTI